MGDVLEGWGAIVVRGYGGLFGVGVGIELLAVNVSEKLGIIEV